MKRSDIEPSTTSLTTGDWPRQSGLLMAAALALTATMVKALDIEMVGASAIMAYFAAYTGTFAMVAAVTTGKVFRGYSGVVRDRGSGSSD